MSATQARNNARAATDNASIAVRDNRSLLAAAAQAQALAGIAYALAALAEAVAETGSKEERS